MSYIIYKSDGTTLCTISDGTINVTSTSLGLPGRLYPGYGQVFDTNFVHLTENFANSSPPVNPIRGQFWYDTGNSVMRISPIDNEAVTSSWMVISTFDSNGNLGQSGSFAANNLNLTNNVYANNIFLNGYANFSRGMSANGVYTGVFSDGIVFDYSTGNGRISVGSLDGINFYSGGVGNTKIFGIDSNGNITSTNALLGNSATASYFTGTLTTSSQPNITSVGAMTGLTFVSNGNITLSGVSSQLTGANLLSATYLSGTLITNAQPNITSVGTLTNLAVVGNITATNHIGNHIGNGSGLNSITAANISGIVANANYALYAQQLVAGAGASTAITVTANAQPNITSVSNSFTQLAFAPNGSITMSGVSSQLTGANLLSATYLSGTLITNAQPNITSVGTLSSLSVSGAFSAATVSGNGAGLNSLTGPNVIGTVANANYALYAQQLVGGAGASTAVTVTANAQPNITSVGTLTNLTVSGNITGANLNGNHFGNGAGLTNINGANVVGTVPLAATANSVAGANVSGQVSSAAYASQAGSLTAGVNATTANTVTNASQPNITTATNLVTVGTLSSLSVSGTIYTASAFSGNGSGITYIPASSVSGTVANAAYATTVGSIPAANIVGTVANATYAAGAGSSTTAGTVTTNAQPNITSVGTLTSLNVTGNITGANLIGNHFGNGSGLSSISGSNVTGNVSNAVYSTNAGTSVIAGTVTTNAQPNITSIGTLTSLNVSGSITAASGTITGSLLTGTITTNAQPNITSVGTLTSLAVTGNTSSGNLTTNTIIATTITSNNITSSFFSGNGAGLTNINGANVTGVVAAANNATYAASASSATIAGTVTASAQPNITSVGSTLSINGSNAITLSNYTGNFNAQGTSGLYYGGTKGGWTKLPNGLIMQWGNDNTFFPGEGGVTVTFPVTFPNMVLTVVAVQRGDGTVDNDMWVQVPYITNTYFTLYYQAPSSGNNGYGYRWVAFGY